MLMVQLQLEVLNFGAEFGFKVLEMEDLMVLYVLEEHCLTINGVVVVDSWGVEFYVVSDFMNE